jgi:hypothetical protein
MNQFCFPPNYGTVRDYGVSSERDIELWESETKKNVGMGFVTEMSFLGHFPQRWEGRNGMSGEYRGWMNLMLMIFFFPNYEWIEGSNGWVEKLKEENAEEERK